MHENELRYVFRVSAPHGMFERSRGVFAAGEKRVRDVAEDTKSEITRRIDFDESIFSNLKA